MTENITIDTIISHLTHQNDKEPKSAIQSILWINNNIGQIVPIIIEAVKDTDHSTHKDITDVIKSNLSSITSTIIRGVNINAVDHQLAREFINLYREQINKEQQLEPARAYYDPIFFLKSNQDKLTYTGEQYEQHINLIYRTALSIRNSLPLTNEELDTIFTLIDSPYEDILLASLPCLDKDYFYKKITRRYSNQEFNLDTLLQYSQSQKRYDNTLSVIRHIGKKIDLIKEHNPGIVIKELLNGNPNLTNTLYVTNLLKLIDSSTYLSSNLDEAFQWVSKELLETQDPYTHLTSKYTILNNLLSQESFQRWLMQDKQLCETGLMNQTVAGLKISTRLLKPGSRDVYKHLSIIHQELLKKNSQSFKSNYINNKPFRSAVTACIEAQESKNNELAKLNFDLLQKIKADLEQKTLSIINEKYCKGKNSRRLKM